MVSTKGKADASTSNSSPNDDATEIPTDTYVSSSIKMSVEETMVVSGSTDIVEDMEGVNDEGKALVAVNNEEGENEEETNGDSENEEENNEENVIAEEEASEEHVSEEDAGEEDDKEIKENVGEEKNEEKVEVKPKERGRKPRKRNRKNKVEQKGAEIVAVDGDKPESSNKKKASNKVEGMGMIFMCSSKTKTDCFRYKVLGLPAGKKDQVQKIYKGMRLFLFDVDLRLMYGIFKAAAPGGYNIEPKAFQSAFPSQVRFTVMKDCLPLAEEKFKKVLKENYYTRNKFNSQLTSEQVHKLCKLFTVTGKGSSSKAVGRSRKGETHASIDQGRRKRRAREEEQHPVSRREHRYRERPVIYEREIYASPRAPPQRLPHLPATAPAPAYVYERPLEMDPYPRDPVLEHRGLRYIDSEPRRRDEIGVHEPYILYREAPTYRDTVYSTGRPLKYNPPATLPLGYRHVGREYHSTAGPPAAYHLSGGLRPEYRAAEPTTGYYSSAVSVPEYQSGRTIYRY